MYHIGLRVCMHVSTCVTYLTRKTVCLERNVKRIQRFFCFLESLEGKIVTEVHLNTKNHNLSVQINH